MDEVKFLFRPAIGGTGLQEDERLIRFIGHTDELYALLRGGLSLTKARDFKDTLEAAGTEADDQWITSFFGSQANWRRKRFEENRQTILATSYISCWHRLSADSNLLRLAEEYLQHQDFKCAIITSVKSILSSIYLPDGTGLHLDLFPVRYLKGESLTLEQELQGEFHRCGYPALEFKRLKYSYEREARFVLHDYSATLLWPELHRKLAIDGPKWKYASINPATFIENIYLFDDVSKNHSDALVSGLSYQPTVKLCTSTQLMDFFT